MRRARIKMEGVGFYHCISRVVDRRLIMNGDEKEYFRCLLRRVEAYCGIRVLTYCLMGNHFHLLIEVAPQGPLLAAEVLCRVRALYDEKEVREIESYVRRWREAGRNDLIEQLLDGHRKRMGDLSEFVKTLKQRFSQWYNRRTERTGTLWESRFKSVLVEGRGQILATIAAYIDLNPMRAGMVTDPKDYRWSGYGEAMAGGSRARKGLARTLAEDGVEADMENVLRNYRMKLYLRGESRAPDDSSASPNSFDPSQVSHVLAVGGAVGVEELLQCRVRYFTDGVLLGTRLFLSETYQCFRDRIGARGGFGARSLALDLDGGLLFARVPRPGELLPASG